MAGPLAAAPSGSASGGRGSGSGSAGNDTTPDSDAALPDGARQLADAPAARLAGGAPLADCLAALESGGATPLAIDLATYEGKPAAVILLPGTGEAGSTDIWVVAPDCSPTDAKILYFANVPAP